MIINIMKTIFAIVFLSTMGYMASYILNKSSWSNFYKLLGVYSIFGIIMLGQAYIVRAYAYFEVNSASLPRVMGISRLLLTLFFTLLSVFSYYLYIVRFKKKRYQRQQNFIWILAIISIVLAVLPQNEYFKENPGRLLPQIRTIPSIILGLYVSFVLTIDGYYKRSGIFQRFGLYLALMQVVQFLYVYIFKVRARDGYTILVFASLIFMLINYSFYRELSSKNELDRY